MAVHQTANAVSAFIQRSGNAPKALGEVHFSDQMTPAQARHRANDIALQAAFLGMNYAGSVGVIPIDDGQSDLLALKSLAAKFLADHPQFQPNQSSAVVMTGWMTRQCLLRMGFYESCGKIDAQSDFMPSHLEAIAIGIDLLLRHKQIKPGRLAIMGLSQISLAVFRHLSRRGWKAVWIEDGYTGLGIEGGFSASEIGCCVTTGISALYGQRGATQISPPHVDLVLCSQSGQFDADLALVLKSDIDISGPQNIIPHWMTGLGQTALGHLMGMKNRHEIDWDLAEFQRRLILRLWSNLQILGPDMSPQMALEIARSRMETHSTAGAEISQI